MNELDKKKTRIRFQTLLTLLQAIFYDKRSDIDFEELSKIMVDSVEKTSQSEVSRMGKTAWEVSEERGEARGIAKGYQEMLLGLLQSKFTTISKKVTQKIRATTDVDLLKSWGIRVITATKPEEIFDSE